MVLYAKTNDVDDRARLDIDGCNCVVLLQSHICISAVSRESCILWFNVLSERCVWSENSTASVCNSIRPFIKAFKVDCFRSWCLAGQVDNRDRTKRIGCFWQRSVCEAIIGWLAFVSNNCILAIRANRYMVWQDAYFNATSKTCAQFAVDIHYENSTRGCRRCHLGSNKHNTVLCGDALNACCTS